MKVFLCYCCCILSLFINLSFGLIGGKREYNPNLSSVVYIEISSASGIVDPSYCTGTIIRESFILTSASCVTNLFAFRNKTEGIVYLKGIENPTATVSIVDIVTLPETAKFAFKPKLQSKLNGNIALLMVSPKIDLKRMKITPAIFSTTFSILEDITVAGYGEKFENGNLNWGKVRSKACPKLENPNDQLSQFHYSSVCWRENEYNIATKFKITNADHGGPVFDLKYGLVGIYTFSTYDDQTCETINYYAKLSPLENELISTMKIREAKKKRKFFPSNKFGKFFSKKN